MHQIPPPNPRSRGGERLTYLSASLGRSPAELAERTAARIAAAGVLPAAADAPNTAPEPRKPRGRAFDVFIGLFGSIARGYLNNRQQVRIAAKIQNRKPKTAQPQYDQSS